MNASKNEKSQSLHRFKPVRHDVSKTPNFGGSDRGPGGL